ncbi:MAG: lysozyme [Bacteroidaceae bacterium]|nr:lysozyme [Bacteroidaceae bacterium]
MTTSNQGKQLIKDFEGLQLKAYRCPAGVPTIGWGHTKGVKMGMRITEAQAEDMLVEDIAPIERLLNGLKINFRQEQFDALVSWIFNLGEGNFKASTMYKRIIGNAKDEEITDQLVKWINAAGRPLPGLIKRRVAEANLFLGYEKYKIVDSKIVKL